VLSQYSWFEHICFSLTALLIQCVFTCLPLPTFDLSVVPTDNQCLILHSLGDATAIVSIFTNTWMASHSPLLTFVAAIPNDALTPERISESYFTLFFFQVIFFVALHLDVAHPSMPQPLLLTPSFTHFDPFSSFYNNYYISDKPVKLDTTTTTPFSSCFWPWLHDRLAGTPLANLSPMTSHAFAGYYTITGVGGPRPSNVPQAVLLTTPTGCRCRYECDHRLGMRVHLLLW